MAKNPRRRLRRPAEPTYRQMVADLAASGHAQREQKRTIREDIVAMVHRAHDRNEPWAAEVMQRWEREGAERDYEAAHTALNTTTYIRNGRRVKKTTSYSMPKRDKRSGDTIHIQLSFWDYPPNAFLEKRNEIAAQGERLGDVVAAMDLVWKSIERNPDAKTARQAWEADGHSTDEIDVDLGDGKEGAA